jgi:energy-coupling factor transporter ATP-binding protein EcfA2
MNVIIGLTGVKTSGKSTVANIIKTVLQENTKEAALADKLKNTCSEVFDVPREYFDRQDLKELYLSKSRVLDLNAIEQILNKFKINPTNDLLQSYITNGIEGLFLESPREIAQIVGTEVLRGAGDEEIHCKNVELNNNGITIISDIRFPNELNYFNNLPNTMFIPLYIQRDEAERKINETSHSSERLVFTFSDKCIKLSNNSDLYSLKSQIKQILTEKGLNVQTAIFK